MNEKFFGHSKNELSMFTYRNRSCASLISANGDEEELEIPVIYLRKVVKIEKALTHMIEHVRVPANHLLNNQPHHIAHGSA